MNDIDNALISVQKKLFGTTLSPDTSYSSGKFGDFSSNLALRLAAKLNKPPLEIAKLLVIELQTKPGQQVMKITVEGPGFINFWMSKDFWIEQLAKINPKFAHNKQGEGKKVQVEFISANPTGPLTLGNARGGFIGDVISRVLVMSSYDLTREYYFNDAGSQIKKLVNSIKTAAGIKGLGEIEYKGEYIKSLAEQFKTAITTEDDESLGRLLTQAIFKQYIQPAIERMDIKFDEWFNERSLIENGDFKAALQKLSDKKLIYEKDGATWLASSTYGDERDRVLVKSGGDITYLGNDIAYHLNIFVTRGFDIAIKEWGADHAGQVESLQLTIKQLLADKEIKFVLHQFVRLVSGSKEVKMSKRAGTFVTTDELLDEVDLDVARWFFLNRTIDSHIEFDLDLAKEESAKNPFYYVMYSYVRSVSLLDQAEKKKLKVGSRLTELTDLERDLVREMSKLPQLIEQISQSYEVHRLTTYGFELARLFHDYYEQAKIIDMAPQAAAEKLYLIEKYQIVLGLVFNALGVKPRKRL